MKFKKAIMIACVGIGVYWAGKITGARIGAKAVMDKYADVIPDDIFVVKLRDNAACAISAIVRKGKGE